MRRGGGVGVGRYRYFLRAEQAVTAILRRVGPAGEQALADEQRYFRTFDVEQYDSSKHSGRDWREPSLAVVAPDGRTVLGKPRDEREARRMLARLAGRTHQVLTGYCLIAAARGKRPIRVGRVVSSRVTMRPLTRDDVAAYVRTGESMDKAGAYAAQGFGMALVDSIRGSYTNVVGLPVAQLVRDLEVRFGIHPFVRARGDKVRGMFLFG